MTTHTAATVADLARSHSATGCADALAGLMAAAFRPDGDPAGTAARDYLSDEARALHFVMGEGGGWIAYGVDRPRPR